MQRALALLAGVGAMVIGGLVVAAEPARNCKDCPEMVTVPAGSFMMGAAGNHKVTFAHSFALSATLVTQAQWKAVMGKNPSEFADCGSSCPVENVSWDDVQIFILKLNAMTGKHYRLPTEAEWEYACRAGAATTYCGGNDPNEVAWYESNSGNEPHPVGTKRPNAWGFSDMSGNVWEWVEDCYHEGLEKGPVNGSAWEQSTYPQYTETCLSRVLRGGSWHNVPQDIAATRRSAEDPSVRVHSIGFRLARSL